MGSGQEWGKCMNQLILDLDDKVLYRDTATLHCVREAERLGHTITLGLAYDIMRHYAKVRGARVWLGDIPSESDAIAAIKLYAKEGFR